MLGVSLGGGGNGAQVTVTNRGTIATDGKGAIGILAKSVGGSDGSRSNPDIAAGGAGQNGSGGEVTVILANSAAVRTSGTGNVIGNAGTITSQAGTEGTAISSNSTGWASLTNAGTIIGSAIFPGGVMLANLRSGTLFTGRILHLGTGGRVVSGGRSSREVPGC
jgi:hypothetical protein